MKTAKQHNAQKTGESELMPGSGLNMGLLERLFESIGCKLVTVKVIPPKIQKSKNPAATQDSVRLGYLRLLRAIMEKPARSKPSTLQKSSPPKIKPPPIVTHSHYEKINRRK